MKRLLISVLLLLGTLHSASSQEVTYNSIATAYVTTTISQKVVFDSTMQAGGTFEFSVLAHNGGGRQNQADTANVKIQFYTSTGGLVSSVNSSYSNNLPIPNAVCGNPCIDPAVPWTKLMTSATLSAAQAATVAYATVSMYGIDGSYWAGDYGPWYRAPTFTLNGGVNLVYNPEFGPYNGITAQGWTSSPGFGACQGAWGGSNACIVNSDGVPGSSTAGLVANANGGGPDPNGGTVNATPGGYNSTMSTSNAGAGTGLAAPTAPTVTSTSTTNSTSSSTSYGSSSYSNVPTMGSTPGVNSNGDPVVVYHQDNTQIIATPVIVTTTTTPVTTTNYSDGTSTSTNGTSTSSSSTTIQYSAIVQTNPAPLMTIDSSNVNWLHLNQIGDNNSVTINQTGRSNQVRGVTQQAATINGNSNTINIDQAGLPIGPNRVDLFVQGSGNAVRLVQGINASGTSTSGHYNSTSITGDNNQVVGKQSNDGGLGMQYSNASVIGDGNTINTGQYNNGSKTITTIISGNNNTVNASQTGTGQHALSTTLIGNGNSANVLQTGSYSASASITLTNAGGPSSATLIQNANNGNAAYSVSQTCVTPSGCSVSVTQNK